jgi:hypothetical protein
MRMTKGVWRVAPLLVVVGCGDKPEPIDPITAPQQMAQRVRGIVEEAGAGAAVADGDTTVISRALRGADDASAGLGSGAMRAPMPAPLMGMVGHSPAVMGSMSDLSLLTKQEQYDETAKDLEVFIRDRLLAASNIESKTDTEVVYLLASDPTCRKLPSQVQPGQAPALDETCARDLAKLQVRIVLRADGDGARFSVQLGPDRQELSAFVVHSDLLAWEIGLASARHAGEYADMALGTAGDMSPFTRLEGRLRIALQKVGDRKVTLSFGVQEAVALETSDALFTTDRSDPLFAVTADAPARQVTFKLAVGATLIGAGWDPRGTGASNKDLHISLGGLYGATTLTDHAETLILKGAGLGHTAVSAHGITFVEIDLDAADGRKLDLEVTTVPGSEIPRLAVTPRFDLAIATRLGAIASDFKSPPPEYLRDEVFGVLLEPGAPPAIELRGPSGSFRGGIKVASGALTLSARNAGAKVMVPEGQCLTGLPQPPAGAHPILGGLTAATCP